MALVACAGTCGNQIDTDHEGFITTGNGDLYHVACYQQE